MMRRLLFSRLTFASVLVASLLLISPIGVKLVTGREDLSFRVTLVALCFAAFLLTIAIAVAAVGRLRQVMFHVLLVILPVNLLAILETAAIALHYADRLLEDSTVYTRQGGIWPAHLRSEEHTSELQSLRHIV